VAGAGLGRPGRFRVVAGRVRKGRAETDRVSLAAGEAPCLPARLLGERRLRISRYPRLITPTDRDCRVAAPSGCDHLVTDPIGVWRYFARGIRGPAFWSPWWARNPFRRPPGCAACRCVRASLGDGDVRVHGRGRFDASVGRASSGDAGGLGASRCNRAGRGRVPQWPHREGCGGRRVRRFRRSWRCTTRRGLGATRLSGRAVGCDRAPFGTVGQVCLTVNPIPTPCPVGRRTPVTSHHLWG
jgi:hypothetical protein